MGQVKARRNLFISDSTFSGVSCRDSVAEYDLTALADIMEMSSLMRGWHWSLPLIWALGWSPWTCLSFFIAWGSRCGLFSALQEAWVSQPARQRITSAFMASSHKSCTHCFSLPPTGYRSQVGSDLWEVAIAPYPPMGEEFVVMF